MDNSPQSAVKVFVSHSHKDDEFTMKFAADLGAAGVDVWVDKREITYDDFIKWINRGLARSHWLLLVMTPDSLRSSWVETEVHAALHLVKQGRMRGVIPIIARPCHEVDIPPTWAVLHRYDATQDYEGTLRNLLNTIVPTATFPLLIQQEAEVTSLSMATTRSETQTVIAESVDSHKYKYMGHHGGVRALTWSPTGTQVASASDDHTVQVWVPYASRPLTSIYTGHLHRLMAVAWSPDGALVASGGMDESIHIWNPKTAEFVAMITPTSSAIQGPQKCAVHHIAWSPDSKRVACVAVTKLVSTFHVTDTAAWIWNLDSGVFELVYRGPASQGIGLHGIAWAPDGNRVASEGKAELIVWNARSGSTLLSTELSTQTHSDGPCALAWSPDGTKIATGHESQKVRIWSASTAIAPLIICNGRAGRINSVDWSPDSSRVAAGTEKGVVQVWNAHTGAHLFAHHSHENAVTSVAWSPDGTHLASSGDDGTVQVIQVAA